MTPDHTDPNVVTFRFGGSAESENDDLDGWRRDHRAYFERNGGWSEDMELICEHFKVVEDLAQLHTPPTPNRDTTLHPQHAKLLETHPNQ